MNIRQTTDIQAFAEQALPFLRQRPAEHNLLLALVRSLLKSPSNQPPALITVEQDREIIAVALQTSARPLLLSRVDRPASIDAIAHHIKNCWPTPAIPLRQSLSKFGGPKAEAALFAKTLRRWTGLRYHISMAMRIHKLHEVHPLPAIDGQLRPAEVGDRPLLIEWSRAFEQESLNDSQHNHERWADRSLASGTIHLWETATGPVSMVVGQNAACPEEGGRIGPVYTPPEQRRRGYATAATAALSQHLLNQGSEVCYLFTDLNNPTSNHIYQQVGYRAVCDWSEYTFQT